MLKNRENGQFLLIYQGIYYIIPLKRESGKKMKNVKEIKIEVKGKEWEEILDKAFNKKKKDIKVDGFRKGSVPKEVFLKKVGIETLFMDACDIAVESSYKEALKQAAVEPVVEPSVNIESVDKSGVTFTFTLISRPEVKLGKYKQLGVKKDKVEVTKEEIEHEIEHIREHMAEVVVCEDGEVSEGSTAVIDFEGYVDGKKLDGGTGANYPLEIGSHTFIPGFEEGLIGMKIGETKELHLKFPEDYVEELKGKDVTFNVTVRELKKRIKPEIDKDFFEDLGDPDVNSLETFKAKVEKDIKEEKEKEAENKYIDELLHKATDNMEVDINNEIIDSEIERMLEQFKQELAMQGVTLEQYLSLTGTKSEDLKTMMKPQALARMKTRYLLEEIVKAENIEVSDDDAKREATEQASKYNMSEEEFLNAIGGLEMIKYDLQMQKAVDIIKA